VGMTIFFVQWELICPEIHLCCVDPNCCGGWFTADMISSKTDNWHQFTIYTGGYGLAQCSMHAISVASELLGIVGNCVRHSQKSFGRSIQLRAKVCNGIIPLVQRSFRLAWNAVNNICWWRSLCRFSVWKDRNTFLEI
jgi:hypothetical protein